jgi:hypothetical protein
METDVDEPVLGSDEPIRKFQQAVSGKEAVEARLKQLSAQVMPAIWDEFIRFVSDSAPDHCWEACLCSPIRCAHGTSLASRGCRRCLRMNRRRVLKPSASTNGSRLHWNPSRILNRK